jgi:hypothetical protein
LADDYYRAAMMYQQARRPTIIVEGWQQAGGHQTDCVTL